MYLIIALAFALFNFSACAPTEPAVPPKTQKELFVGKWQSTCVKARDFGISENARFQVLGDKIVRESVISREADCSIADVEIRQTDSFEFMDSSGDSSLDLTELDLTNESTAITPLTELGASILRLVKFCGQTEWQVGITRDIENLSDRAVKRCLSKWPSPNRFQIKGENKLYFAGTEVSTDSVTLDQVQFFKRE